MTARLAVHQDLGAYRLTGLIGTGGMGAVYRAMHRTLGREVAIKVIERGETGGPRFENEARIQASLAHPNIAAMHEYFEHRGLQCLVMELVPGETLAARIARDGAIAPAQALALLEAVATAAAYMHGRGIVHRDLTASNVRITPDGRVKVLDFGIAKLDHLKGLTEVGQVIGTPAYLAPEQLRSGRATPQSDVWALGVLLFEMIAGRLPFRGRFPNEIARAIEEHGAATFDDVVKAGDSQHARVTSVLARCLATDPTRRFADAGELLTALRRAHPTHPTHPTHRSHGHQNHRTHLNRRTHHVAAAAVILAAAAFFVFRDDPAAAPTTVHRIDVTEGVADVVINGRRLGRTPFDYAAARRETVSLELRQPGYAIVRERFVVTERPFWTFSMRRER